MQKSFDNTLHDHEGKDERFEACEKAALTTLLNNKISQHEISRKAKIDRKTIPKYGRQINAASSSAEGADSGFLDEAMVATGLSPSFATRSLLELILGKFAVQPIDII